MKALVALVKVLLFSGLALVLTLLMGPPLRWLFYWLLRPLNLPDQLVTAWGLTPSLAPDFYIDDLFSRVPALLLASFLTIRYLERRPFATLGLGFYSGWSRNLGLGMLIAALYVMPIGLFSSLFDVPLPITVEENPTTYMEGRDVAGAIGVGSVLAFAVLLASTSEELLFRGYLLQALLRGLGYWPAVLLTSGLFGLAHFFTHRFAGLVGAGILGLFMALAYLRSKSLWAPIGFHVAVNWLGNAFAVAGLIRGLAPGETFPVWASWAFFGVAVFAILLLIPLWLKLKPHPQMEQLWQQHIHPAQPWARLRGWWLANRPNA